MSELIQFYHEGGDLPPDVFGNKGKGLIEISKYSIPVPECFFIHKDAYNAFINANGIYDKILSVSLDNHDNIPSYPSDICESIRSLIREFDLQEHLHIQIMQAYQILKGRISEDRTFVVRSSVIYPAGMSDWRSPFQAHRNHRS